MKKEINARQAAFEILGKCRRDGAWAGAGIDSVINKYGLDRRDGALVAQLCLGVLENSALCDFYIASFYSGKIEPKLRDILRLGVYQLIFLDKVPAHAAVNECVALCAQNGCGRASGLVNAVLRRVSENRACLPEIPGCGSSEYLSILYSHPQWLCDYLIKLRGYEKTEAFLKANNAPAAISIQVNSLKISTEEYAKLLSESALSFEICDHPDGAILISGGQASAFPGFDEGLFYVQDNAARLSIEAAGLKPGMRVLDACASPGGKSFAAAISMRDQGSILSCDIHENKLKLVSAGAERLGLHCIATAAMDARVFDESMKARYDAVIADVPCSGIGVIRKKPEIRGKSAQDIAALPGIQSDILNNLSQYVCPGGLLIYSTCTVIREENELVVERFLESHSDFATEPFKTGKLSADSGCYTFWPDIDGTDGFFVARLRKKQA